MFSRDNDTKYRFPFNTSSFQQFHGKKSIINARIACVIWSIVYIMFAVIDYVDSSSYHVSNYILQAVVCLFMFSTFLITFTRTFPLIHNILLSIAICLFMGGLIFMNFAHNDGYTFRDVIPIIVLPHVLHYLLYINFIYIASISWILQALYSISMPLVYGFGGEFILLNIFMVLSNVMAIIISYRSECRLRREFYETNACKKNNNSSQNLSECCFLRNLFFASMTHELRTPIHGIWDKLQQLSESSLTKSQRHNVCVMRDCSQLLISLTDNLLEMSNVDGKIKIEEDVMSICDVVEEAVEVISATATIKRLKVSSFISSSVPDNVVGDAPKLRQILVNLLGNAIKFTVHGEVHVNVSIEAETDSVFTICFKISDTGIGIPPEDIPFLWHRYTSKPTRESRLGLILVDHLIKLMKGELSVSSLPGVGSTFQVLLSFSKLSFPCPSPFPSPSPHPPLSSSPTSSPTPSQSRSSSRYNCRCQRSSSMSSSISPYPSPPSLTYVPRERDRDCGELLVPQELSVLVVDSSEHVCETVCAYMQDASPTLCVDTNTQTQTCVEFCGVSACDAESALHWLSLKKFAIVIINDWSEEAYSQVLAELETNPFMTSTQVIYAYQEQPPNFHSFPSLFSRSILVRLPFRRSCLVKCLYRCAHSALFGSVLHFNQEDDSCACQTETNTAADISPSPSPPASPLSTRTISVFSSFNNSAPSSPSTNSLQSVSSTPPASPYNKRRRDITKLNEAFIQHDLSGSGNSISKMSLDQSIDKNKIYEMNNSDKIKNKHQAVNITDEANYNSDNSSTVNNESSYTASDTVSVSPSSQSSLVI